MTPLPPEGWPKFAAATWARRPAHWRNGFGGELIDVTRVLRILRRVTRDRESAGRRVRVFLGRERQSDPHPWLPTTADASLDAYRDRMSAHGDFTVLLNGATAYDATLYQRAKAFLRALGRHVPLSIEHDAAVYVSDARITTFGPHRDEVNNFIFLVHGKKRFRVWPSEYDEDLASANVYDLTAGDVLYIPTGRHHVAESEPGLAAHLSITLVDNGADVREFVTNVAARIASPELTSQLPMRALTSTKVPPALTRATKDVEAAVADAWAKRSSAFGFLIGPPLRRGTFADDDVLAFVRTSGLRVMTRGAEATVYANGHSFTIPAHPKLLDLIAKLQVGGRRRAREWQVAASGRARIAGEVVEATPDYVRGVLESLFEMRAIRVER